MPGYMEIQRELYIWIAMFNNDKYTVEVPKD